MGEVWIGGSAGRTWGRNELRPPLTLGYSESRTEGCQTEKKFFLNNCKTSRKEDVGGETVTLRDTSHHKKGPPSYFRKYVFKFIWGYILK